MKDIDIIVTRKDELCSDIFYLTSKSKKAYNLIFNFITPWEEELTLQAVFKPQYCEAVAIDLDIDMSCVVPDEVLSKPGVLGIGLRGIVPIPDEELDLHSTQSYQVIKNTPYLYIPIVRGSF